MSNRPAGAGVDFSKLSTAPAEDKRFQRERAKESLSGPGTSAFSLTSKSSSTFDALKRMAVGLEGRTLAEKINDPNRLTWEEYKKVNESKLADNSGEANSLALAKYREELDRERERKLKEAKENSKRKRDAGFDNDNESSSDSSSSSSRERRKEKKASKKASKKEKKHKKEKKNKKDKKDKKPDEKI